MNRFVEKRQNMKKKTCVCLLVGDYKHGGEENPERLDDPNLLWARGWSRRNGRNTTTA